MADDQKVWVLNIYANDNSTFLFQTLEGAEKSIQQYVEESWDMEWHFSGDTMPERPKDLSEAVQTYFDLVPSESYDITLTKVWP